MISPVSVLKVVIVSCSRLKHSRSIFSNIFKSCSAAFIASSLVMCFASFMFPPFGSCFFAVLLALCFSMFLCLSTIVLNHRYDLQSRGLGEKLEKIYSCPANSGQGGAFLARFVLQISRRVFARNRSTCAFVSYCIAPYRVCLLLLVMIKNIVTSGVDATRRVFGAF